MGRARVAELVDALDLGSSIARCGGSTPSARTIAACSLCGAQASTVIVVHGILGMPEHGNRLIAISFWEV
jgi:hypothetical protein